MCYNNKNMNTSSHLLTMRQTFQKRNKKIKTFEYKYVPVIDRKLHVRLCC